VAAAFTQVFGDRALPVGPQSASEDFSDIPRAWGIPYTYWFIGGIDPGRYEEAANAGRVAQDTSRSTTPPPSHRLSSRRWTPEPRRWWLPL
jgi:hypothetical protein